MAACSCRIGTASYFFNPEQVHDGMAHNEEGLDYVMLYIDPQLLLEATEKKEIIRFTTPILYDDKLASSVVKLANAILGGEDEALCSELFLSLTDFIMRTDFDLRGGKDHALTRRAKEMLHSNLELVLNLDEICDELGIEVSIDQVVQGANGNYAVPILSQLQN